MKFSRSTWSRPLSKSLKASLLLLLVMFMLGKSSSESSGIADRSGGQLELQEVLDSCLSYVEECAGKVFP